MAAIPSLQSMSMVKVAVSMCNDGSLKEDIFFSSLGRAQWERMMETKSRTTIKMPNVPVLFRDLLANQILLVAIEMRHWSQFLDGQFDLDGCYCASMLGTSMFTSNGKVDKVKVAKEMAGDQQLDVSKRFEIACFYWLEDCIVTLWSRQMTVEQRRAFYDVNRRGNVSHLSLPAIVACKLGKGGDVFFGRAVVKKVIECAVTDGSEIAVRHHWSQLDPAKSERFATKMLLKLPFSGSYDYLTEESADISCFLLTKLKEHQRLKFLFALGVDLDGVRYVPLDVLVCANRMQAILDVMSTSMKYVREGDFVYALTMISERVSNSDLLSTSEGIFGIDYREFLKNIWALTPVRLKRYAFYLGQPFFTDLLLAPGDTRDIVAFLLKDATLNEKLDLIFSEDQHLTGLICEWFIYDCYSSVSDFLLQLLDLSQDEKRQRLKREILVHDPLTCDFSFGLVAQYCLQFEDEETKAEYKQRIVGDRIEEICIHYILNDDCEKLDDFLSWYFSTAEEIRCFKDTLLETLGPDICLR